MAAQELLQHYLNQARACEQSGQLRQRDRFLVLALDIAWQAGKVSDAEQIWQRLRAVNPHHVLVGFASLQQALENTWSTRGLRLRRSRKRNHQAKQTPAILHPLLKTLARLRGNCCSPCRPRLCTTRIQRLLQAPRELVPYPPAHSESVRRYLLEPMLSNGRTQSEMPRLLSRCIVARS
jgi:hypothetical protein